MTRWKNFKEELPLWAMICIIICSLGWGFFIGYYDGVEDERKEVHSSKRSAARIMDSSRCNKVAL